MKLSLTRRKWWKMWPTRTYVTVIDEINWNAHDWSPVSGFHYKVKKSHRQRTGWAFGPLRVHTKQRGREYVRG